MSHWSWQTVLVGYALSCCASLWALAWGMSRWERRKSIIRLDPQNMEGRAVSAPIFRGVEHIEARPVTPEWRREEFAAEAEDYRDLGDPLNDYAESVGIPSTGEL